MKIPAIVTAGDRRAAKSIRGESKVYLEIGGRPLVAHTVAMLQRVPEIDEVFVVGDAKRLEAVLGQGDFRATLRKPLTVVPQFRNLYENAWQSFRRSLPGAGPTGRDPGEDDADRRVLFLSADLPFATAQEVSAFVRGGVALDCDYAVGLCTEASLADFTADGEAGMPMAFFNLREDRYRQNNLHLVKPCRLGNRHYIEEMYEHRYQRELGNILGLAWRILRSEGGGLGVVFYYGIIHLAGVADRHGLRGLADWLRRAVPASRVEKSIGRLLRTRFRFMVTEAGGCAADIDNEHDYAVAQQRFEAWRHQQQQRAEQLYGQLALPAETESSGVVALRVLPEGPA